MANAMSSSKLRKWRVQFRLTTMLVLVFTSALAAAWYVRQRETFRDEQRLLSVITLAASQETVHPVNLEGFLALVREWSPTDLLGRREPFPLAVVFGWDGPTWSRRFGVFGVHCFQRINALSLRSRNIDDDVVPLLSSLKGVKYIDLRGSSISNHGYRQVKKALSSALVIPPDELGFVVGDICREMKLVLDQP